ncbi:hypothetical protein N566_15460 [Streptomycetaceae bacterium MP113-05]|nr:hypothetical protein N566_15460 [Streptomycetaceae bacterium MP113-05]
MLIAVGFVFRDRLPDALTFAQGATSGPEPLRPDHVRASSSAAGHQAAKAFDGFSNRYWSPADAGDASGAYLEADFAEPIRLQRLLITPGASAKQGDFLTEARPAGITVTVVSGSGERHIETIKVKDQPGGQSFDIAGQEIVRVRLTVQGAYGARRDRHLSIAEVEFFGRR